MIVNKIQQLSLNKQALKCKPLALCEFNYMHMLQTVYLMGYATLLRQSHEESAYVLLKIRDVR